MIGIMIMAMVLKIIMFFLLINHGYGMIMTMSIDDDYNDHVMSIDDGNI